MTNNEKNLDRTKYDNWKLNNNEDEMSKRRNGKKEGWESVEYKFKVKKLGKCPYCEEEVSEDELFVEEKDNVFHFSCYNYTKVEEVKKKDGKGK